MTNKVSLRVLNTERPKISATCKLTVRVKNKVHKCFLSTLGENHRKKYYTGSLIFTVHDKNQQFLGYDVTNLNIC